METKRCAKCGEDKPRTAFSRATAAKDGLQSYCKKCAKDRPPTEREKARASERAREWYAKPENREKARARSKAWREANRERSVEHSRAWRERNPEKRREVWVKAKYKLTDEQYAQILAHHGICDACEEAPAKHTDHDHKTGEYRGRLCAGCNQAAGLLLDSPRRAIALAAYLVKVGCPPD